MATTVDNFIKRAQEGSDYPMASGLGAAQAALNVAALIAKDTIEAFDHQDSVEIVANMRPVILSWKTFLKSLEED